ncbi:Thioredoxin-1 [compost metagenome]
MDQNPETASLYGVRSIPTILFFKDGELVDKVIGAVPRPQLEQRIQKHLAA